MHGPVRHGKGMEHGPLPTRRGPQPKLRVRTGDEAPEIAQRVATLLNKI